MQAYLAAHDDFIAWIDELEDVPSPAEVGRRLTPLALCAANRGMNITHWTFVVDGLVAHVNRLSPESVLLSSYIDAQGFDLAARWDAVVAQSYD